jgi:hypothetical protein
MDEASNYDQVTLPSGNQAASQSGTSLSLRGAEEKERHICSPGTQLASLTAVASRRTQAPSLHPTVSYVDGHGYLSAQDEDDNQSPGQDVDVEGSPDKSFQVTWDGDDDPMNPRNKSTTRKWFIVITLAFGSLCVTCTSSLYTTTYGKVYSASVDVVVLRSVSD